MEYRRRLAIAFAATLATAGHPARFPLLTPCSDRQVLIEWLEKNDPNGTYDDESSIAEFGEIMTLHEAWETIERQTEDYTPDAETIDLCAIEQDDTPDGWGSITA